MLATMEKSWFGKILARRPKKHQGMVPPNVDYADADMQFSLGLQFASSAGAAQDYVQAAGWYRKAAEQNHCLAQFNLGTMYANGQGVARDDAESVVWFGRAANQGDAGSQYNMGRSCQRASVDVAIGVATEARIEAYKWYELAAAQGYKNSEGASATLTFKMSREDVTEAGKRVAKFTAVKNPKPLPA